MSQCFILKNGLSNMNIISDTKNLGDIEKDVKLLMIIDYSQSLSAVTNVI